MFRKIGKYYNPKIDYKMLYFLNPQLDISKNYYETKKIYDSDIEAISTQGKWFKKLKHVYDYLFNNELNINEILGYASIEFETEVDDGAKEKIKAEYQRLSTKEVLYLATWFLKMFFYEKPLKENSDILGILIFNAMIKRNRYIPMIFMEDYRFFLSKIIHKKVTTNSLKDILSIYEDLSIKYDKKYSSLSKVDVIHLLNIHKEHLMHHFDIKKVWLYGSFVRNEENDFSDVDLYVEFQTKKTEEEIRILKNYFVELFKRDVDMLVEYTQYHNFSTNALKEREVVFDDYK